MFNKIPEGTHNGKCKLVTERGVDGVVGVCSCGARMRRDTSYKAWVKLMLHRAQNKPGEGTDDD